MLKTNSHGIQQHLKSIPAILISLRASTESDNLNTEVFTVWADWSHKEAWGEKTHIALTLSNKSECCKEKPSTKSNTTQPYFYWKAKVTLV